MLLLSLPFSKTSLVLAIKQKPYFLPEKEFLPSSQPPKDRRWAAVKVIDPRRCKLKVAIYLAYLSIYTQQYTHTYIYVYVCVRVWRQKQYRYTHTHTHSLSHLYIFIYIYIYLYIFRERERKGKRESMNTHSLTDTRAHFECYVCKQQSMARRHLV